MAIFYRHHYTTLWLNISSNEQLGVLDTGYIEDYNGVDGHITLFNVGTSIAYDVVMVEVPAETPGIPNDYLRGGIALAGLPDGLYQVRCRVRDVVGNYTIIGSVSSPNGTEQVLALDLTIATGSPNIAVVQTGPLTVRGGLDVEVPRVLPMVLVDRFDEAVNDSAFVRQSAPMFSGHRFLELIEVTRDETNIIVGA